MLPGLIHQLHYLVLFYKLQGLGWEPNSAWLQKLSFYTQSGQYISPDFTSLNQPWLRKMDDLLREALLFPT